MEKLKKSYSLEDLHLEMLEKLMIHPSPAYRRSVFNNSYLTEKHLKTMSLNDPDLHIRRTCKEELEKRFGIKDNSNSKKTKKVVDYTKMDLKGVSIGNEDYEDLMEEKKDEKYSKNNSVNKCFKFLSIIK